MEYKNILLIKMSSLGDILHTLPFAAALRQRFPKAKITWLVHPQFAGFVPDPPVIDEIIYFDKVKFNKMNLLAKLAYFQEMRRLLHSKKFDLVIDMQGLFKSAVLLSAAVLIALDIVKCVKAAGWSVKRFAAVTVMTMLLSVILMWHVI